MYAIPCIQGPYMAWYDVLICVLSMGISTIQQIKKLRKHFDFPYKSTNQIITMAHQHRMQQIISRIFISIWKTSVSQKPAKQTSCTLLFTITSAMNLLRTEHAKMSCLSSNFFKSFPNYFQNHWTLLVISY